MTLSEYILEYGMWVNKSTAKKILGLIPFNVVDPTPHAFPGRSHPLYLTEEVVKKGKSFFVGDRQPVSVFNVSVKSADVSGDVYALLDN